MTAFWVSMGIIVPIFGGLIAFMIRDERAASRRWNKMIQEQELDNTAAIAQEHNLPWIESDGAVSYERETYRFPL